MLIGIIVIIIIGSVISIPASLWTTFVVLIVLGIVGYFITGKLDEMERRGRRK
jgi:uncharacterized membrane protein